MLWFSVINKLVLLSITLDIWIKNTKYFYSLQRQRASQAFLLLLNRSKLNDNEKHSITYFWTSRIPAFFSILSTNPVLGCIADVRCSDITLISLGTDECVETVGSSLAVLRPPCLCIVLWLNKNVAF